jgi:hypothetical protein
MASGLGDHFPNILKTPPAGSLKAPRSEPGQVRLGAGDLDRESVEAGEEATSTGDLVGILAGLAGNGVEQVQVTHGAISWESGNLATDTDTGTPAANAARRKQARQPKERERKDANWSGSSLGIT